MEQYIQGRPFTRIDILCDKEFTVWSAKDGDPVDLLGPASSQVRRAHFTVPPNADGLLIASPVDTHVRVLSMVNTDTREDIDTTSMLQEEPQQDTDPGVADMIRAELSRLGLLQLYGTGSPDEPLDEEKEDDWDDPVDNDMSEPWAKLVTPHEMVPDFPDEASAEVIDDSVQAAQERADATLPPDPESGTVEPQTAPEAAPVEPQPTPEPAPQAD